MRKIEITRREETTQVSLKLPSSLKRKLSEIAEQESSDFSSIVRDFLEYGIANYTEGKVVRVGDSGFMKSLRNELEVEDEVIASGIFGVVKAISTDTVLLEIAEGVTIKVWKDSVSDLISPLEGRTLPTLGAG